MHSDTCVKNWVESFSFRLLDCMDVWTAVATGPWAAPSALLCPRPGTEVQVLYVFVCTDRYGASGVNTIGLAKSLVFGGNKPAVVSGPTACG